MEHWHIVGICGIGMSALAQFARAADIEVSGSDRALENPENASLKAMLQAQNIALYPQDGSRFISDCPPCTAVIYSTAIEESNPDFAASKNIPKIHRAAALKDLIKRRCAANRTSVAVAGTCGKTSTTALISEALANLGADPECINGGMIKRFNTGKYPGNYRSGSGAIVFEADESDKSLLEFHPDYALVLNIGTDHYPKAELVEMFAQFVNQTARGAVMAHDVYLLLKDKIKKDLTVRTFAFENELADCNVKDYHAANGSSSADFGCGSCVLPAPGIHTALNTAATAALLELMEFAPQDALNAALNTSGVARRFDFKGRTASGCAIYDDYAHNPEKIANILTAAQELTGASGRVLAFFQPHGYGPFGFMADELGRNLAGLLRANDRFYLAEPFYAGGTSSFSPHADEVLSKWQTVYPDTPIFLSASREETAEKLLAQAGKNDVILIMGARDNTLPLFAQSLSR